MTWPAIDRQCRTCKLCPKHEASWAHVIRFQLSYVSRIGTQQQTIRDQSKQIHNLEEELEKLKQQYYTL